LNAAIIFPSKKIIVVRICALIPTFNEDKSNNYKNMFNTFDNLTGGSAPKSDGPALLDSIPNTAARYKNTTRYGSQFSKIFRWQPADPRAPAPASVQLAGSFTDWRTVTLTRDALTNTWQLRLDGISGNRTHRYMLLVNGEPANDKNCDGLAVPEGVEEQQYQLMTARGPRVFLLFAQTK
jgi:hypothetical protein